MNVTQSPENRASEAYKTFYFEADTFDQVISQINADYKNGREWQLDALKSEADRLKKAVDSSADAIKRKFSVNFAKAPAKTLTKNGTAITIEDAGNALRDMRSQYNILRQVQSEAAGTYREPVQRVPFWQTVLFWVSAIVILGLFVQFIAIPAAGLVNRIITYNNATQAAAIGDWDAAIEGFYYTYTTGPYQDSEARLLNSYSQAVQGAFNTENWDQARAYGEALLALDIANNQAQGWINDSYFLPARDAFVNEEYAAARELLDNLPLPLNDQAEVLYKRSLFEEADDIASSVTPDWAAVETLMLNLAQRPTVNNLEATEIEQAGRELLSVSYTARAQQLIDQGRYEEARDMLEPARRVPLLNVANKTVADALFFNTYLADAISLIEQEEYEPAREELNILLSQTGLTQDFRDLASIQLRRTFYLPGVTALQNADYETARENFAALIELDAPEEPYLDTYENYYTSYYRPAMALLEPAARNATPDFAGARAIFEAMFAVGADRFNPDQARESYYDTFYRPALALMEREDTETPPDYLGARAIFDEMFAADPESVEYVDTRERYFDTFYFPASELLRQAEESEEGNEENYVAGRAIFEEMFEFDSTSILHRNTRDLYFETFYIPAETALLGDPENNIEPDYVAARELLQPIIDQGQVGFEYENTLAYYYDTFYYPALVPYEADPPDYAAARELFETMFAEDPHPEGRAREHENALTIYWNTIYEPALEAFGDRDYLAARNAFEFIIDDGGQRHLFTERYYLETYFRPGMDYLNGDNGLGIEQDFALAREQFAFIRNYLAANRGSNYSQPVNDRFAETYLRPANIALEDDQYEAARENFAEVLALMDRGVELSDLNRRSALNGYQETYLEPALIALDDRRYEDARTPLIMLLDFDGVEDNYRRQAQAGIVRSYTEPAETAINEQRYEDARVLLETLYTEYDTSEDTVDLLERTYDPLIRQAITDEEFEVARAYLERLRVIKPSYESSNAELLYEFYYSQGVAELEDENWESARSMFVELIAINNNYRDSQTLLLETYYDPALNDYESGVAAQDAELCINARDALNTMIEDYPEADDFRDTSNLINQTYVCQIDVAIADNDMVLARELINELLSLSPYYANIAEQFIITYYNPAKSAFDAGDYQEARDILEELVTAQDQFFYSDAFILLREAYYVPALRALDNGEWTTARAEFSQLLEIDPNYKDAPARYREAFVQPAINALNSGDWERVRAEVIPYLTGVDGNDNEGRTLVNDSYFLPAQQAVESAEWGQVREALNGLYATDIQYQIDTTLDWRLRSNYEPALRDYENENWTGARQYLEDLIDDLADLRNRSQAAPALANALSTGNLLDAETDYLDSRERLYDTYFIPGANAFAIENWQTAREELGNLSEINPDYTNPEYNEKSAKALFIDAYLQPGINALNDENWTFARENLRPIITEHSEFATEEQLSAAFDTLIASYEIPAAQAEERGDWATARGIYEEFIAIDADLFNIEVDIEDETIIENNTLIDFEAKILNTYTRPVEIAIEIEAYDSARQALSFARDFIDPSYYDAKLRETYEIPFNSAVALQDWFSAAEQFVSLSQIVPADDAGLLALFTANPELRVALANRSQSAWERIASRGEIRPIAVNDIVFDVAYNVTGTQYATVALNGYLQVWPVAGDAASLTIINSSGWYTEVEWEPTTGEWLATANNERRIDIWDASSGQLLRSLSGHTARITDLTISEDGALLASSDESGRILVWQTADWSLSPEEYTVETPAQVTALALSPDNTLLGAAQVGGQVMVFDTASKTVLNTFDVATTVNDLVFTPDSSGLLTLGHDNMTLWTSSDASTRTLTGHGDWIRSGYFLPNNQRFISVDASGSLIVWDANRWIRVSTVNLEAEIIAMDFAPNSQTLIIAQQDNQMLVITAQTQTYLSQGE